nr:M13 family metallopeptidase [Pseudopedobacter sp.]
MKKVILPASILMSLLINTAAVNKKDPSGIDLKAIDKTINPADDFYQYANGTWLRENPVPASESKWGSFNIVGERNNLILKNILEEAAADRTAPKGSGKQKVGTFYRLFLDTIKRDQQGVKPVLADLKIIDKIDNNYNLMEVVGRFHRKGIRCFFNYSVGQDLKNSTSYISYISQGGLGLPDRDYYFKTDKKSEDTRTEYIKHIVKMTELFEIGNMPIENEVMAIEKTLALKAMTRTERRNQEKQYNKKSLQELLKLYPDLQFETYFKTIGVSSKIDSLIVSQPDFFENLNSTLKTTSIPVIKAYLRWCVMNNAAGYLDSRIEKQNFYFYSTVLSGTKEQKPMWKRGIAAANGIVGELLGQLFVAKTFTPDSKKRVNAMVNDIVEAFKVRLNQLEWMSESTREKAQVKLASFNRKFGYPDKWKDYSTLEIKEDSYLENSYRAGEFGFNDMISNLGKPIDRGRWGMLPQTVNAYYSPTLNEIVFPAAIMQPPFFDASADDAVNYGSIGAVIGHELTHGFDDQGAKYGADGNLKSWWTEEDKKLFEAKTKVLANQYNQYFVSDSLHVNGELTLGENIADLGGLTIAYEAYQMRLKKNPGVVINGFTPEQRFFIGFAQIWKNNIRPEAMRQLILTDPHSPGIYRVFGSLSNMPEFYAAFGVKEGAMMYRKPDERANIW